MSSKASATMQRWLSVGSSTSNDSKTAATEATQEAVQERQAKLLIVFCSESHDLEELVSAVRNAAGDVPMIGCSTAGEIATDGPSDSSIVVTAFGGDGFQAATAAGHLDQGLREGGQQAAACLNEVESGQHRALLLLSDGLAGDQQEILRGAYSVAGASIPLVGGCAGDDLKMHATAQFCDGRVLRNSVVAAAISSDAPLGVGVRHGWRAVGAPFTVTRSHNNRVYRLDDQPALDVYLDHVDAPADARRDAEAFAQFAITHPLGLARRSAEENIRLVSDANFEDRSLGCIAEVPQGGITWIMQGDDESVLDATDHACTGALEALKGETPLGLLAFDCVARKGVLGDAGAIDEVDRIARHAKGAPVAGFYSYGEFARTGGIAGFHNQTLVVLAVA